MNFHGTGSAKKPDATEYVVETVFLYDNAVIGCARKTFGSRMPLKQSTVTPGIEPVYEADSSSFDFECCHSAFAENTAGVKQTRHDEISVIEASSCRFGPGVPVCVNKFTLKTRDVSSNLFATRWARAGKLLAQIFDLKTKHIDLRE